MSTGAPQEVVPADYLAPFTTSSGHSKRKILKFSLNSTKNNIFHNFSHNEYSVSVTSGFPEAAFTMDNSRETFTSTRFT
jgi:hypothetical protein